MTDSTQPFSKRVENYALYRPTYTPLTDHPRYESMLRALRGLFDQFQENDQICFLYTTRLYFGPLA